LIFKCKIFFNIYIFSAYCGGLWLAALYCTVQISNILKQENISEKYSTLLNKAKESFNTALWNGNLVLIFKALDFVVV